MVYDIEGFLEKNNDSLHDNLLDLLDTTVDPFLRRVLEYVDPEAGSELFCRKIQEKLVNNRVGTTSEFRHRRYPRRLVLHSIQ